MLSRHHQDKEHPEQSRGVETKQEKTTPKVGAPEQKVEVSQGAVDFGQDEKPKSTAHDFQQSTEHLPTSISQTSAASIGGEPPSGVLLSPFPASTFQQQDSPQPQACKREKEDDDDDEKQLLKSLVESTLERYNEQLAAQIEAIDEGKQGKAVKSVAKKRIKTSGKGQAQHGKKKFYPAPTFVLEPNPNDVLFGRKNAQRLHPGSIRLRDLCAEYRSRHSSVGTEGKALVTMEILQRIQQDGGRFLKKSVDGTGWNVVDKEVALEKISFTMRDTNPELKKKQKSKQGAERYKRK